MATFPFHKHHEQDFERLEKTESWVTGVGLAVCFIIGAAMAIGLMSATGHVTW